MKNSIVIKSNPYGITLFVNQEQEFEDLIREICTKFAESRSFWGQARFNLNVEGAEFTEKELAIIVEAIELNSDITIKLVEGKSGAKERQMLESVDRFYFEKATTHARIIKGDVPKKEDLESDTSLLVLGDVKPGASVTSKGSIIVLGTIYGEVHAGCDGDKGAFIIAGDIKAEQISIASTTGPVEVHKKWALRRTKQDILAATLWHGELICEPFSSGMVKHL